MSLLWRLKTFLDKGSKRSPIASPSIASAEELWAMKHASQMRDVDLLRTGKLRSEDVLFIKPEHLRRVQIEWPKSRLK